MHEIGIASAIIEAGQAEALRCPGSKLLRIGVRIGALSGVDNDALTFAFKALIAGTDLDLLEFEVQNCERRNRCSKCGLEFESPAFDAMCPQCFSTDTVLIGGDELDLAYVELEDA
jgi:hydrogenase nickel incorporation protein HypA/HybF